MKRGFSVGIEPNVAVIVRKKQKFFWISLVLLLINLYLGMKYIQVPEDLSGQVIMVLTLFNFPLFVFSVVLGLAPLMYKKRYEQMKYFLMDDKLEIHSKNSVKQILTSEIDFVELLTTSAIVWCDEGSRRYDLDGLTPEHLKQIKKWSENINSNFSN